LNTETITRFIIYILILIQVIISSCSQNKASIEQRITNTIENNLEDYNVKGGIVSIIIPGYKKTTISTGTSHDTVKIKSDMFFAIGSITKNFVAALSFKLVEQGIISLNDTIGKWLPRYKHVESKITIGHLLQHTSGLYMFWDNQKIWDDLIKYRDSIFTPETVLSYIKEPYFKPGKGFHYSNTNFLLLALIIKKATGSSLSVELNKQLLNPLNIKDVYLSQEEELPNNLMHVWGDNFENDGSFRDITNLPRTSHESITYGSSGIFITAESLAEWCNYLFTGKVLGKTSMSQMLNFNEDDYGLGVHLFDKSITDGEKIYGHGGANIGTCAYMAFLPEYNVSIIVVINAFSGKCLDSIFEDVVEIVVDEINQLDNSKVAN